MQADAKIRVSTELDIKWIQGNRDWLSQGYAARRVPTAVVNGLTQADAKIRVPTELVVKYIGGARRP